MKHVLLRTMVSLVVIVIIAVICLAGCKTTTTTTVAAETTSTTEIASATETTKAEVSSEDIILKFIDYQGGNQGIMDAYKQIIQIFEEEHPGVKVEYQQYTVTTFNEFLKPAISSGTAPDMFAIYAGPDVVDINNAGALRNLTPDIDDEWKSWMGNAINYKGIYDKGNIVVIPQDALTECVWYHKDMLKEIGWEIPEITEAFTPEDFAEMVQPAKAKGYDVVLAGFVEPWCYYNPFFNFVHQQQVSDTPDMVEEAFAGKISWQQAIFKNAIEVFVKMNNAGVWNKDALSMDYQVQAFGGWLERKSIFMFPQGDWFAGSMKPEENNMDNPNIGITQYPLVNMQSTVSFNKNFGSDIAVYSKGKHQDLSVAFARFTNSPQAAKIFVSHGVNPACGLDASNIPETDNPVFNECLKLYNAPGRVSEIIYSYPDGVKALGDGIGNVMLGLDTIDNVLKNLDKVCGFKG